MMIPLYLRKGSLGWFYTFALTYIMLINKYDNFFWFFFSLTLANVVWFVSRWKETERETIFIEEHQNQGEGSFGAKEYCMEEFIVDFIYSLYNDLCNKWCATLIENLFYEMYK